MSTAGVPLTQPRKTSRRELASEAFLLHELAVFGSAQDEPTLRGRAAVDLEARVKAGDLAYLVLALILLAAHPLPRGQDAIFGAATLVLVSARRLVVVRKSPRWRLMLTVLTVGIGVVWGTFAAAVIAMHGRGPETLLVLICIAGVSAGATTSLALDRVLHVLYTGALLAPSTIALAISARDATDIWLVAMFLCYLAYLTGQGRRNHTEYWHMLATAWRLEVLNAQIQAASAAKSGFLADMGHQLRTPMTAIRGFADLLLDAKLDPADRECVETIHRNSDHLLAIINDLLDLSRIEAGKLKIELTRVCPGQLALDVEALLGERARRKKLALTATAEGLIPAEIMTDALRVRQIVVNLAANAIRYTECGGVQLIVRMVDGDGPPRIAFVVRDTGIGMSADQRGRLFEPFGQIDAPGLLPREGTGLGLSICAKLAEALGGAIALESEVRVGTTATLTIPTGPLAGVPRWANLRGTAPDSLGRGGGDYRSASVLIVEDDVDSERMIRAHLERLGNTVTSVSDGAKATMAALDAATRGEPYDVILMDMRMPDVDGYSATRDLREHGYAGRIVAVTANAMAGDRDRCLAAGCDDYLTKPIDVRRLLEAMTRQLAPGFLR